MAVNRVSITINSRQYTVVAEESREYIERLGEHINEKVKNVLNGGQNVLGERPIVLAALNICDEYFKALESDDSVKVEIEKLNSKIYSLFILYFHKTCFYFNRMNAKIFNRKLI